MRENKAKIKEIVEKKLGFEVYPVFFEEEYEMALRKQKHIFGLCKEKVVLEDFYLATLTEEYLRILGLQIKAAMANERRLNNEQRVNN